MPPYDTVIIAEYISSQDAKAPAVRELANNPRLLYNYLANNDQVFRDLAKVMSKDKKNIKNSLERVAYPERYTLT